MMQTKMATMMTSTITLPAHGSLIAGQGIVLFDLPIGSVDHADDDSGHNQEMCIRDSCWHCSLA